MKLRLYRISVCSSFTHCCEAWTLNRAVTRSINGFNSRCLHVMTGEHYRETATAPAYDLVLAVRRRRLRYLGHVLRMPPTGWCDAHSWHSCQTPLCIQSAACWGQYSIYFPIGDHVTVSWCRSHTNASGVIATSHIVASHITKLLVSFRQILEFRF